MPREKLESRSLSNFMDKEFGRAPKVGKEPGFEVGLVFVVMPLGDAESDEHYDVYRRECTRMGLHVARGDDAPDSGVILKYVVENIERAEFLICDLSKERPNVYYELGYAHGVGNHSDRVLLTASSTTTLHFDISPFRVHFYDGADALRRIMRSTFKQLVRVSRAR